MKKIVITTCILALLIFGGRGTFSVASSPSVSVPEGTALPLAARMEPLIVDHHAVDVTAIPQAWIEKAKNTLHIYYGHTSHGSQLTTGMAGLIGFANNGGLGLSLPENIFAGLPMQETSPDAGYWPDWRDNTVSYLGAPDPATGRGTNHLDTNVVIWSWCGQVSGISEDDLNNHYLLPMTQLESTYPGITFVYMTGHADGSGDDPATSNLHARNQQIRQYTIDNNKVLYDFYDIELYDPDGSYYGDKATLDTLWYDSDGNGSRDKNWGQDWQAAHTQNMDWYDASCAHSESINCNQKAYAAWWLWASLAGWNASTPVFDLSSSSKAASQIAVQTGDTVTYTIQIINDTGALTNTVHLTDTVPAGLDYIPGSLSASSGTVDESNAPILTWTGVLTPTPEITVTYAVTVTAAGPLAITSTAVLSSPGYDEVERYATVIVDAYQVYLPLVIR